MKKPFNFVCYTENPENLDKNIKVIDLFKKKDGEESDRSNWQGWWSKVNIFDGENYSEYLSGERLTVMYIDLDMIITGPID